MVQKCQYPVVVDVNIFCVAVATEMPSFTGHQRLILNLSKSQNVPDTKFCTLAP